jgi:Ca2+-binding RTX toxin-like protein
MNCCRQDSIKVPEALGKLRFWRNTSVATLAPGQVATLAPGAIGYEADEALDNGFQPSGLVKLSSTTLNVGSYLLDYGSTYGSGIATHSLTEYRHSSGALVFGAGTIRWPWGLDVNHDFDAATPNVTTTPDIRMQQATVNLFADMGVQPATLQSGLVAATPLPPTLTALSPSSATAGGPGFTLTTTGSNFVRGSVVRWNGANRTTTFVNSTQLTAGIPAADIASPGAAQVVTAANPDGAVSNALTFTIAPPPPDTTPPTVTSALPADGATGVSTTTTVSAGFSEPMDQATISTTTVKLAAGSNPPVSATVTYNATIKTATLTPSSALGAGVLYTATVKGGAGGVKDVAGNALATDFSWSFTTATTQTLPVLCNGLPATIVGTDGNDYLVGTPGNDVIHGLAGNDTIFGLGGDDVICGGPGRDKLYGNSGNDKLFGGAGNDVLKGGRGQDRLFGQSGNDVMDGGSGFDRCDGGSGTDKAKRCERRTRVP